MSRRTAQTARAATRGRGVAFVSILLCASSLLLAAGCGSRECKERLVESKESPDRRHNAAVLVRNCGGAQAAVTHVNLHAGYGTAPPADGDGTVTRGEVFSVDGVQKVEVVWKGARSLQVECAGCGTLRVSRRESSWEDVQISYVGLE